MWNLSLPLSSGKQLERKTPIIGHKLDGSNVSSHPKVCRHSEQEKFASGTEPIYTTFMGGKAFLSSGKYWLYF